MAAVQVLVALAVLYVSLTPGLPMRAFRWWDRRLDRLGVWLGMSSPKRR